MTFLPPPREGQAVSSERTLRAWSASLLGVLPRPSIWAEPGSEIPWGQPVTIVCQGPAGAETLHLEEEGSALLRSVSDPVHETQARFPIPVASKDTAGRYRCLYYKDSTWSDRSKELQLVVTGEDISPLPSGLSPAP